MSKNLSTASESNPEVMSEGDKVRAYSTCDKHTGNSGGHSAAKVPPGCRAPDLLWYVAPKDVDREMVYSRSSVS